VIVVDASVIIDLLLALPPRYQAIVDAIREHARELAAPHLLDAEVGQVLRRFVRTGSLDPARANDAIQDLLALGVTRYPHGPLLPRAFELRDSVTVYDGLYLALAEALRAPLLTGDAVLASVAGIRVRVDVLS